MVAQVRRDASNIASELGEKIVTALTLFSNISFGDVAFLGHIFLTLIPGPTHDFLVLIVH